MYSFMRTNIDDSNSVYGASDVFDLVKNELFPLSIVTTVAPE
jgi:hypothetical protein